MEQLKKQMKTRYTIPGYKQTEKKNANYVICVLPNMKYD